MSGEGTTEQPLRERLDRNEGQTWACGRQEMTELLAEAPGAGDAERW